ncbi:MAG: Lrp/AsnC family transcriptional regulator [Gammaproteobacteria bacterium]|nr:Lrp/AsnC family transcriptional regulator [Gammaproteobacteria bacterium]
MILDDYDVAILAELQRDGRVANRALAERVALSAAPCWRRVRALERGGVIGGYAALLEPAAIGLDILAFAHVSLDNHHPESRAPFDAMVHAAPEILECYMTSGDYDYILKIVAPDMPRFERFLSETLLRVPSVRMVNTRFVLRRDKQTTELPLDYVVRRAGAG